MSEWRRLALKRVLHEVNDPSPEGVEPLFMLSKERGLLPRASYSGFSEVDTYAGYKRFRGGDLVMNKMQAWNGVFGTSDLSGLVSPDYAVFRMNQPPLADVRYLNYLLRTPVMVEQFAGMSRGMGSGFNRLHPAQFLSIDARMPSLDEQRRIADFLDDQATRIDQIIAARSAQAGLVTEWWTSTLGNALAAESQVPLGAVAWWQEGPGILASEFRDEGVPILRIAHLRAQPPSLDGCQYVDARSGMARWGHFLTKEGDLIISGSASVGEFAIWITESVAGAIPYTGLIRTGPRDDRLDGSYLRYFYLSHLFTDQVDRLKQGIGIQHWGPSHLSQVRIPLPSRSMQRQILTELSKSEALRNAARGALEASISRLQELKGSLIAAAVSGNVDVSAASGRGVPA